MSNRTGLIESWHESAEELGGTDNRLVRQALRVGYTAMRYIEGFEMWRGYPITGPLNPTETTDTSQLLEKYNDWVNQTAEV
jgi:hypothetical protein